MRYRLRTLLILLAIAPPVIAAAWLYRYYWPWPLVMAAIGAAVALPLGYVLAFALNTAIEISRYFQR